MDYKDRSGDAGQHRYNWIEDMMQLKRLDVDHHEMLQNRGRHPVGAAH